MQNEIFLSYSRRDTQMMQRVRDDLYAAGLNVWTDEGIHPGTPSWKESIEKAICQAYVVVVLLSPEANESKWVQREIDYAEVQDKPILSILVRGHPKESIPFALAGSQYVDVRRNYEAGIHALLKRCVRYLPKDTADNTIAHYGKQPPLTSSQTQQGVVMKFLVIAIILTSILAIASTIGWHVLANQQTARDTTQTTILVKQSEAQQVEIQQDAVQQDEAQQVEIQQNAMPPTKAIEMRYNRDTFVLQNLSDKQLSIRGLRFEQETEDGQSIVSFAASNWINQSLLSGRCVQAWRIDIAYLSGNVVPANSCYSRIGYRATVETFWVSQTPNAIFIIRRNGALIATCPAVLTTSTELLSCSFDL